MMMMMMMMMASYKAPVSASAGRSWRLLQKVSEISTFSQCQIYSGILIRIHDAYEIKS